MLSIVGSCVELLDFIAEYAGCTYTFIEPKEIEWGVIQNNKTWTGMERNINHTFY